MLLIHADGGCQPNPGLGSCGIVIYEDGAITRTSNRAIGPATNNIAEWRGAIEALSAALESQFDKHEEVELRMDSRMVIMQLKGLWRVKDYKLRPLAFEAAELQERLRKRGKRVTFTWVPREQNECADRAAASVR
jgi:ribonuclease HI